MSESTGKELMRDVRIDRIGMVGELQKQYADDLKSAVKCTMLDKSADRAEGDYFDAVLSKGETRTIDPAKFYGLLVKKKITKEQFLSAIRVSVKPAEEFLSGNQIDGISSVEPSTPALTIRRKKGVVLALLDVIKQLSSAVSSS